VKIRTLIAQCAAAGAIAAGGLTLTTGTAQAAVNCNYLRTQISAYQDFIHIDAMWVDVYRDLQDYDQMTSWQEQGEMDYDTMLNYQSRFRMAHCA